MSQYNQFKQSLNEEVSTDLSLGKLVIDSQLYNKRNITIRKKGEYIIYSVDGEPWLEIKDIKNKTRWKQVKPDQETPL